VQEQGASDGGILYGWAEHRVVFYLEALQRHLPRVAEGGRRGASLPMLCSPVFCSPAPPALQRDHVLTMHRHPLATASRAKNDLAWGLLAPCAPETSCHAI